MQLVHSSLVLKKVGSSVTYRRIPSWLLSIHKRHLAYHLTVPKQIRHQENPELRKEMIIDQNWGQNMGTNHINNYMEKIQIT